ncbi:MAG: hypothetical protein J6X88_00935 [Bacteroidales bacterium]|nr:hypothetical protein [Bacteroidales bacterium]
MDWSEIILLIAVAAILFLYIRLMLKNKRLRQMADEANRLRLEASEAERRNRQLKQEMTSNIAHELKTPVSSIRGYLEILLSDKPVDDERRRHYLERSYSQTLRLSDLIQDVSIINKLEESADLFPRTEVDACEVAKEAIGDLGDKAAAAGITVSNQLPPMPLQGNHELLYCIFRNLVENSIAYAGRDISIVLETYEPIRTISDLRPPTSELFYFIHYYDTGKGVADEYLSRLFDRFVRIDEGRSRQNGGTGLGLSIVKHSVLFHGGEIYAKNRAEGGLEFFFSLKKL